MDRLPRYASTRANFSEKRGEEPRSRERFDSISSAILVDRLRARAASARVRLRAQPMLEKVRARYPRDRFPYPRSKMPDSRARPTFNRKFRVELVNVVQFLVCVRNHRYVLGIQTGIGHRTEDERNSFDHLDRKFCRFARVTVTTNSVYP